MTVTNTTARNQYTATAGQTVFAYTFEVYSKNDLVVLQNGTTLAEGTNYTVSGVGSDSGGNITLTSGATAGDIITVYRDMALERLTDYQNAGDFLAAEVNEDFDRLWLATQQNATTDSRAIRKPISDLDSINVELPEASSRASKFLSFDANGNVATVAATGNAAGNADSVTYNPPGTGAVARTVQSRLRDSVSVKDFGAKGDGTTDDLAAFNAASDYCEDNTVRHLVIPAGVYNLSDYWVAPHILTYENVTVEAFGARVNETVVVGSCSILGLQVNGSPDAGFVFLRGQHAYHAYLLSENNHYGFYWGIASRQYITVADSTGFQVGETVTGGTSSSDGVIKAIVGNQLQLVKCNTGDAAKFFAAAETVTGGTSSASSTVSSVLRPYGNKHGFNNYQFTRSSLVQCTAKDSVNKSWFWDGSATANRSWFNANSVISPTANDTGGKGWRVSSYAGPSGNSEHNYNVFSNINIEGGLSPYSTQPQAAPGTNRSLEDTTGRQNTFLGGHFVNQNSSGESVQISDSNNFVLGGRYTGTQDIAAPFKFYNTDATGEGGILASLTATDTFTTSDDAKVQLKGTTFQKNGFSMLPQSKIVYTKASDDQNNHTLAINLSGLPTADVAIVRVVFGGWQNHAAGYNNTAHFNLNLVVSFQSTASGGAQHVDHSENGKEGCTIDSVGISSGTVTITFDTTHSITSAIATGEYYDDDDTNLVNP